jgi:hypothetical protein
MITKFETSGASGSSSKGGNTLLYVLIAGAVAYGLYTYVIKPEMEKQKALQK